jgi:hypothetical protein
MPFRDFACHVWAIDGYDDEPTAKLVNDRFTSTANSIGLVGNNLGERREALRKIVNAARVSDLTQIPIIVYGGFRDGASAPEHMWIEYNNTIYETMPGHDLCHENATPASRVKPQLEGYPFGPKGVANINTKMTVNQRSYLISQGVNVP